MTKRSRTRRRCAYSHASGFVVLKTKLTCYGLAASGNTNKLRPQKFSQYTEVRSAGEDTVKRLGNAVRDQLLQFNGMQGGVAQPELSKREERIVNVLTKRQLAFKPHIGANEGDESGTRRRMKGGPRGEGSKRQVEAPIAT